MTVLSGNLYKSSGIYIRRRIREGEIVSRSEIKFQLTVPKETLKTTTVESLKNKRKIVFNFLLKKAIEIKEN